MIPMVNTGIALKQTHILTGVKRYEQGSFTTVRLYSSASLIIAKRNFDTYNNTNNIRRQDPEMFCAVQRPIRGMRFTGPNIAYHERHSHYHGQSQILASVQIHQNKNCSRIQKFAGEVQLKRHHTQFFDVFLMINVICSLLNPNSHIVRLQQHQTLSA